MMTSIKIYANQYSTLSEMITQPEIIEEQLRLIELHSASALDCFVKDANALGITSEEMLDWRHARTCLPIVNDWKLGLLDEEDMTTCIVSMQAHEALICFLKKYKGPESTIEERDFVERFLETVIRPIRQIGAHEQCLTLKSMQAILNLENEAVNKLIV